MVDLHVHLLPEIDEDGPPDLTASLEMAEELVARGFDTVIVTPHCIEGVPSAREIMDRWQAFNAEITRRRIPLKVLPGAELAIEPQLLERVKSGEIMTLNGGRYLLVELPLLQTMPSYAEELLFQMKVSGYCPILAHPERIKAFQKDLSLLYRLVSRGVYVQVTLSSLTGMHGLTAKKAAWTMLEHQMVHFMATDAHSARRSLSQTEPAMQLINKKFGGEAVEEMLKVGPGQVLRGDEVELQEPLPFKKRMFQLFRRKTLFN